MDPVVESAVFLSFAGAACYLFGRKIKRRADYLGSITRVVDGLKSLDELLAKNTTNLLVVVSGRVGSAAPLNCKHNGLLSVLVEEKAKLDCEIKLEGGGLIEKSLKFLLHQKETPWYLEDSTGQVNVVGVEDALGFNGILNKYEIHIPASELLKMVIIPEGTKVLKHDCHGRALNIGTFLTFLGEAVRDKAGNVMIQRPKEQSLLVYSGEGSFENMVDKLKSMSEDFIGLGKIMGTIGVAVAVMYGVHCIIRVLLPFLWEKIDLGNRRSENAKSDRGKNHQREESDNSPLPKGLACLLVKDSGKDC
ncbi:E3 Ubiquitin ligase GIDE-type [Arabidopsis suecica]|uniref:RING-type E3 ubiquitin transferase n=1 Tax=Arabidopsis suecica TaxID=45249 RepID=A0A8T2CJH6_ARASU|nr:E3 Ubiquitin ligase GIDE-type [Arabidopsis suecica]